MKKSKILNLIELGLNVALIAMELYALITAGLSRGEQPGSVQGVTMFNFFTNLSNIFFGLTAVVMLFFNIKSLLKKENVIPEWASALYLCGTVAVTVTFFTVIFFLGPSQGFDWAFNGDLLFLHLLCPVFAIISYAVVLIEKPVKFRNTFFPIIPVLIYACVYLPMVTNGAWDDFYGLVGISGGTWWGMALVIIVFIVGTYAISFLLWLLNKFLHFAIIGYTYCEEEPAVAPAKEKEASVEAAVTETKSAPSTYKDNARVYHISRHGLTGSWKVKLASGEKAIKLFKTQKEAIDYAKTLVKTQGGSIRIHSMKGQLRKE